MNSPKFYSAHIHFTSPKFLAEKLAIACLLCGVPTTIFPTTICGASNATEPLEAKKFEAKKESPSVLPFTSPAKNELSPSPISIGWEGLDIQFPTETVWTSAKLKAPAPDRKTFVYKGTDAHGPTQLIISQFNNNFAAKLWDGAGVQWEAIGNIANPIRFNKVFKGKEQHCGGTPPVPPEIQAQFPAGGNEGGVAGSICIDSETLDVLVAYSPCALQQFYRATFFVPPPGPQCPELPDPFDPDAALALLKTAVFLQEDAINQSFDNSLISTPTHERHIRIVAIVDTNQVPECLTPSPWAPDPFDPGYSCYQPEFDPLADPQKCDPLVPKWCGEDFGFADDLDRVANPNDPDYGGLLTQKRDYHRADFVVLLRVTGLEGIGGIATLKQQNAGCDGSTGFCVVDVMSMGAMGHEMGHNLGCCHEPGQGGSFNCTLFPYSFGHRFTVAGPPGGSPVEKKTIMAYATGEEIPNFSNPSVLFQGQPTGTSQTQYSYWSDNARTIRETFDDARCYRCADVTPPAPLEGQVSCWGRNNYGQTVVPQTLTNCTKVAAGGWHTLALQVDGKVFAWGAGTTDTGQGSDGVNKGQSIVPTILTDPGHQGQTLGTCSDIAAGLEHSVAIRIRAIDDPLDGTVIAWGGNDYGQRNVPVNLGPCNQVAAGYFHTVALRRDGTVRAWGAGVDPTIDQYPDVGQSAVPQGLGECNRIAAGAFHTVVIRGFASQTAGGEISAWGAGTVSQANGGLYGFNWGQSIVPYDFPTPRYFEIAAGKYHTLALKSDGTVTAWGAGTTSAGPTPKYGQSIVPASLGICTKLAAGGYHSLAIKADEKMGNWGAGLTNTGNSPNYGQSIPVPTDVTWIEISAGEFHTVGIQNNASLLPCAGDFNNDGRRDGLDMTTLLSGWGTANGDCNGDGTTNGLDISYLLSGWGFCQ